VPPTLNFKSHSQLPTARTVQVQVAVNYYQQSLWYLRRTKT